MNQIRIPIFISVQLPAKFDDMKISVSEEKKRDYGNGVPKWSPYHRMDEASNQPPVGLPADARTRRVPTPRTTRRTLAGNSKPRPMHMTHGTQSTQNQKAMDGPHI